MKIEAQGVLEPEDYIEANRLHLRPSKWTGWMLPGAIFILLCNAVVIIYQCCNDGPSRLENIFPNLLVFFAVAFYLATRYLILPYLARRTFKQQKDLHVEWHYELSDDLFASTSELGNARLDWSHFIKWKYGKNLIAIYRSDRLFHMLPKRFFKDGDFETLIEFLKTKLPQK